MTLRSWGGVHDATESPDNDTSIKRKKEPFGLHLTIAGTAFELAIVNGSTTSSQTSIITSPPVTLNPP
jgi:hypothetical protein